MQHSLAQLPGALVLQIKRFKPLVSSSGALGTTNTSSTADGVSSAAGSKADPPLQEVRSSLEGLGSRVSGGQSCWSRSGTRGEVSNEKLMAPVSIPTELDLERFCSSSTANAPTDDLGEVRWALFLALVCGVFPFPSPFFLYVVMQVVRN